MDLLGRYRKLTTFFVLKGLEGYRSKVQGSLATCPYR